MITSTISLSSENSVVSNRIEEEVSSTLLALSNTPVPQTQKFDSEQRKTRLEIQNHRHQQTSPQQLSNKSPFLKPKGIEGKPQSLRSGTLLPLTARTLGENPVFSNGFNSTSTSSNIGSCVITNANKAALVRNALQGLVKQVPAVVVTSSNGRAIYYHKGLNIMNISITSSTNGNFIHSRMDNLKENPNAFKPISLENNSNNNSIPTNVTSNNINAVNTIPKKTGTGLQVKRMTPTKLMRRPTAKNVLDFRF